MEIFKRKLLPAVAPSSLCINLSKVLSKEVQESFLIFKEIFAKLFFGVVRMLHNPKKWKPIIK